MIARVRHRTSISDRQEKTHTLPSTIFFQCTNLAVELSCDLREASRNVYMKPFLPMCCVGFRERAVLWPLFGEGIASPWSISGGTAVECGAVLRRATAAAFRSIAERGRHAKG